MVKLAVSSLTEQIGAASAGPPFEEGTEPSPIWTTGGAGSVNVTDDDTITINSAGTNPTFARRVFTTEIGREYILTANVATNPSYFSIGTTVGGADLYESTIFLVNMIGSTTAWTDAFGSGTVDVSSGSTIVITGNNSGATGVRKSYTVVAGKHYRIKWTTATNTCASAFGTTSGGEQYKGLGSAHDPLGSNEFTLLASGTTLFIQFQRTPTGTCAISALALEQLD